jgi:acetolactate synthase-1/2/3 large subunit
MDRYADQFMGWLEDLGFSHCFFLAGGGSMHLVDAASKKFTCVPVVHEVSAVIAAEYFNESNRENKKAFALVTTGPGLTNTITGIAGAWLESRDCLIVGGQVKKADLATEGLRQKGIQEVDGVSLVQTITKGALRVEKPISRSSVNEIVKRGESGRKGPVFLEFCIDASATPASKEYESDSNSSKEIQSNQKEMEPRQLQKLREMLSKSKRPLLLLGSGVSQSAFQELEPLFERLEIPIASTWTGADRISSDYKFFAGRPNTYGMRWANVFQQQADLLIAVGTRLNLQQTGFNFEEFMPVGNVIQVDIDENELKKLNPGIQLGIAIDSDIFLRILAQEITTQSPISERAEWIDFLEIVQNQLPLIEEIHNSSEPYVNPYSFINKLSEISGKKDLIVSCSSGGTFTATHQSFLTKRGQQLISNKGLASMGYGLAGAIGAAFSNDKSRVLLLEGDGGFAQNLQDLGTVARNHLNIKMFVICNEGYASIRSSQKSYFKDNYVGCDIKTGLGLPKWSEICSAYGIRHIVVDSNNLFNAQFMEFFDLNEPIFFEVLTDPNMLYFPKVASKILEGGTMVSSAIHDMSPKISQEKAAKVFKYLPKELWGI